MAGESLKLNNFTFWPFHFSFAAFHNKIVSCGDDMTTTIGNWGVGERGGALRVRDQTIKIKFR